MGRYEEILEEAREELEQGRGKFKAEREAEKRKGEEKAYFIKAAGFYKEFLEKKKAAQAEYAEIEKDPSKYSKHYIKVEQEKRDNKIDESRIAAEFELSKLADAYNSDIVIKSMPNQVEIDESLVKLLKAGITFTPAELLSLAEKYRQSVTNSRLIYDYAADKGYTLNNYIFAEEKKEIFEHFRNAIVLSMGDYALLPPIPEEEIDFEIEAHYARTNTEGRKLIIEKIGEEPFKKGFESVKSDAYEMA